MSRLKKLMEERSAVAKKMTALTDTADKENRDFSEQEDKDFTEMEKEHSGLTNRIRREERMLEIQGVVEEDDKELEKEQEKRKVEPAGQNPEQTKPKNKVWSSFGEQLQAVMRASLPENRSVDKRLIEIRGGTGLNESNPADGGFLVDTDFSNELLKRAYDMGQLASRVRRIPISSNSNGLVINAVDETSRATGSRIGGIRAYWVAEAGTVSPARPKFRQIKMNVHKLMGLCYATDELLSDAPALQNIVEQGFAEEFSFMIDDAIFRGDGAGKPLGLLNHPATVVVAKEGSQSAAGIIKENIIKMRARLWAKSRANSVWFINQDCEPQLNLLTLGDLGVYFPAGSFVNQPEDRLFGRPVIPIEHAETMGTKGDISLFDLSQYLMIDKGTVEGSSSVHVRFLYDEQVFRFIYRVDGQSGWNTALTPYKGTDTVSPFVQLAVRP